MATLDHGACPAIQPGNQRAAQPFGPRSRGRHPLCKNSTNGVECSVLNRLSCAKVRAIGAYLSVFCFSCDRKFPETQHNIMKKLMFTLALSALVTMGVQAQKQMGDEHNIEVAFTPFEVAPSTVQRSSTVTSWKTTVPSVCPSPYPIPTTCTLGTKTVKSTKLIRSAHS